MVSFTKIMETRNRVTGSKHVTDRCSSAIEYLLLGFHTKPEAKEFIDRFEEISRELVNLYVDIIENTDNI